MYENNIGNLLKEARIEKGLSLRDIAGATKIRSELLEDIEENQFDKLNSHVYAKGLIKNYALFLGLDPKSFLAIYKRDFENTQMRRSVRKEDKIKEEEEEKKQQRGIDLNLSRRQATLFSVILVLFIFIIIVINLIGRAFAQPYLKVNGPVIIEGNGQGSIETEDKTIKITGETVAYTLIKINEEPISLKPGFLFETDPFPITSERNIFIISATSQLGVKTEARLEVIRKDIPKNETPETAIIITVKDQPVFMLARGDGIIQFNDQAAPNDVIRINAERSIEIETTTPESLKLNIDGVEYQLTKATEKFEKQGEIFVQL